MLEEYILIAPTKDSDMDLPIFRLKANSAIPMGWKQINEIHGVSVMEDGLLKPIFKNVKVYER